MNVYTVVNHHSQYLIPKCYEKNPSQTKKILVAESLLEMFISLHYTRNLHVNFRISVRCLGTGKTDSNLS